MTTRYEIDWRRPWGVLSDAHGNPLGLAAALDALQEAGAATIFFLGDAVGYLPLETAVIEALERVDAISVSGNHDAMLTGRLPLDPMKEPVYGLRAAAERLEPRLLRIVAGWPKRLDLDDPAGHGTVLMVHGGPDDPWRQYIYPDSDLSALELHGYKAVFLGQTHHPFVRRSGGVLVVNVGSCGLPRDVGNMAACALYDPVRNEAEILRAQFDTEAVLTAAENVGQVAEMVRSCLNRREQRMVSDVG